MKYILVVIFLYLGAPIISFAQQTDSILELDEITIIQSYEPILIGNDKIPISTELPKITKTKPDEQAYFFSDGRGKISYTKEEIKPVKTTIRKPEKSPFFYTKAGFGNYLTPLLNIAIVNPKQTNYRAGLTTNFIMSKAKDPKFQQYFDLNVKGFGEYFIKNAALIGGDIRVQTDQYHFYGTPDSLLERDDVKNLYKRFGADIYLQQIQDKDFDYSTKLSFTNASNAFEQKENNINVTMSGSYWFSKNIGAGANIFINDVSYKDTSYSNNRFSVGVTPYAMVRVGELWRLKAGAAILVTNNKFQVLPSIQNTLKIYKDFLVLYNEWNTSIKVNSLHETSQENPFVREYNFLNEINEKRTFAGLKGAIKGFGYDINFSQLVNRNDLQYIHPTTLATELIPYTYFRAKYIEQFKALNPHVGISYSKGNNYGMRVGLDYFIYNKNDEDEKSYQPNIKTDVTAFYNWKEKLNIELNIIAWGKMNATSYETYLAAPYIATKVNTIKGIVDVNLSATYFFTKNIGVFVDLNNLAFQKYQRYSNYPTYGFQAIGGIKVSY